MDSSVPTEKSRVAVYLNDEDKEAVINLAELDDRSVSSYVGRLISEEIARARKDGRLPQIHQASVQVPELTKEDTQAN